MLDLLLIVYSFIKKYYRNIAKNGNNFFLFQTLIGRLFVLGQLTKSRLNFSH